MFKKYFTISLVILSTSALSPQSSDLIIESGTVFYVYLDSQISSDFITVNQGGGFYADDPSCVAPGTTIRGEGDWNLPVELTYFTAELNGTEVILSWVTETEVNNYGFEIERTNGELEWSKIGFVDGYGNSNSTKRYFFTDKNPIGGSVFIYRLKQIDNDGRYEYSDEIEVEIISTEFALYQNYPNPFNPNTKIRYSVPQPSNVIIRVFDILGNEIETLVNEEKPLGTYEIEFSSKVLSSGVYYYILTSGTFTSTKKLILLK
jgi:hypothetical protein